MMIAPILLPLVIPLAGSLALALVGRKHRHLAGLVALIAMLANLAAAIALMRTEAVLSVPWGHNGIDFSLRLYHFSRFLITAIAGFALLIALYSHVFMAGRTGERQFYLYFLLSVLFANGAVLADNMIAMLFFWEGLLGTLFGMIAIGTKNAFRTAVKAFIIIGISDLTMMAGIALAGHLAGTLTISKMHIAVTGLGGLAFILIMIGAIAKAGSMPFHSWIPDAALDAPLPFMAILPASLEKLLGIYFLARIALDIFALDAHSWISTLLMIVGALTILLAVMMALVQKNYKRLLSYHAISQVGYMVLGIGTMVPAGIIGGIFHMINHAMYKSCLFLTGGAVERQAGTAELEKLGGLGRKMPVTFACFVIAACAISGVPPFNGFFSKELVYDGALERHVIFYIAAVLGSFLTAASFLKLGHAAFIDAPRGEIAAVREAPLRMLIPMIVIAAGCILFGVWNALPLEHLIQPILGHARLEGRTFAGMPANPLLIIITVIVIVLAVLHHRFGAKRGGSGLKAADHIHHAPGLGTVYDLAAKRVFDPYDIGLRATGFFALLADKVDRAIDWCYMTAAVRISDLLSARIRTTHNGSHQTYLIWSLVGGIIIVCILLRTRI